MKKHIKVFGGYLNLFESIFLVISLICIIVVSIIVKSNWLATACGILGLLTIFFQATGKVVSQIIGVFDSISYAIFSYKYRYFGEFFVYSFVLCPIFIYGIFEWFSHKNKDTVKINTISKKESISLLILAVVTMPIIYITLNHFDTELILLNTISIISLTYANYLISRRCSKGFLFFLLNDIILFSLWIIPILGGDISLLPLLISSMVYIVSDLYGLIKWKKLKNKH